jgi:hypothetical protein
MIVRELRYELLVRRPCRHARQSAQPDIAYGLLRKGDVGRVTVRIGHCVCQWVCECDRESATQPCRIEIDGQCR